MRHFLQQPSCKFLPASKEQMWLSHHSNTSIAERLARVQEQFLESPNPSLGSQPPAVRFKFRRFSPPLAPFSPPLKNPQMPPLANFPLSISAINLGIPPPDTAPRAASPPSFPFAFRLIRPHLLAPRNHPAEILLIPRDPLQHCHQGPDAPNAVARRTVLIRDKKTRQAVFAHEPARQQIMPSIAGRIFDRCAAHACFSVRAPARVTRILLFS